MGEEQKRENEKEIQAILSDLDAILSNLEATPEASPAAPAPVPNLPSAAPSAAAAPLPQPSPEPAPAPKLPPILEPPAAEPPSKTAAVQDSGLKIELGPRPVTFKSAAKKPEAAKPLPKALASEARPPLELGLTPPAAAAPSPAAPAPSPAAQAPSTAPAARPPLELGLTPPAAATPSPAAPAPGPAVQTPPSAAEPAAAPAAGVIPDNVDTDLVRRVAFVCAPGREQENAAFVASLHKAALTISRKPLYLREVLNEVLSAEADVMILSERIRSQRAVAALGVLDGLPEKQVQALGDSLAMSGVVFKPVKSADIENRATVVDLLVDLMILRPES